MIGSSMKKAVSGFVPFAQSLTNPPVFDRIFRRLSLSDCACLGTFQRLKNGTVIFKEKGSICKFLKDWLLRLDSNQQPSG